MVYSEYYQIREKIMNIMLKIIRFFKFSFHVKTIGMTEKQIDELEELGRAGMY